MHPTKEIKDNVPLIRAGAAMLTKCVDSFESYLGQMTGRVETTAQLTGDVTIWFRKEGKHWQLLYRLPNTEWALLRNAPLTVKLNVIPQFNSVLEQIEQSQDALIQRIAEAIHDFDAFAAQLPGWSKLLARLDVAG